MEIAKKRKDKAKKDKVLKKELNKEFWRAFKRDKRQYYSNISKDVEMEVDGRKQGNLLNSRFQPWIGIIGMPMDRE